MSQPIVMMRIPTEGPTLEYSNVIRFGTCKAARLEVLGFLRQIRPAVSA